jgi:hypothetical protein
MEDFLNQLQDDPAMFHWYKMWTVHTVHPDLKINYFQNIDTKEKAYWLGFLYADGCLVEYPNRAEIRLKLKIRDEDTIDKFCDTLQLNKDKKEYVLDEGGHKDVLIRFCCRKMSNDLIRHGLTFRKSKTIQLPDLQNIDLDLAFLLGYYDGDGRRHTSVISSGSKQFLEQVKERYGLPFEIYADERDKEIYGRKFNGINYLMSLGSELVYNMMMNYTSSMPRKRWIPCRGEEKIQRIREACTPEKVQERRLMQKEWRAITKERLEELVRQMPLKKIAEKYNVSNISTVASKCQKYGIPIPERGYWTKVYWARVRATERNKKDEQVSAYPQRK